MSAFTFPAEAGTHLPIPEGWKTELALGGWLVTYRNKCPASGIEPGNGRSSHDIMSLSITAVRKGCVLCTTGQIIYMLLMVTGSGTGTRHVWSPDTRWHNLREESRAIMNDSWTAAQHGSRRNEDVGVLDVEANGGRAGRTGLGPLSGGRTFCHLIARTAQRINTRIFLLSQSGYSF